MRTYISIDLKSFYASVECVDLHLDPLSTNLVVADSSRTEKTICLAVSPSLKAFGIPARARLFEINEHVRAINARRRRMAPHGHFSGRSVFAKQLAADPSLELDFIVACPRMGRYLEVSSQIYAIYLRYIAPADIHVYSIDEVFIDATQYLRLYQLEARAFAVKLIREVLTETGITATAGIGPNLYLCKVSMDIVAKHINADKDGVRIAEIDVISYRRLLWGHRPLTDFWRIGGGIAARLESNGMFTLGDVARMSIVNENLLYRLFGINAELLIDHAWGLETCTIADIKSYQPQSTSLSIGQVLSTPYSHDFARTIVKEMTDSLVLELAEKGLVSDQMVLYIGYEAVSKADASKFSAPLSLDRYGRLVPEHAHGSVNLERFTASFRLILPAVLSLYERITNPALLIRRITVAANYTVFEAYLNTLPKHLKQLELFDDSASKSIDEQRLAAEKRQQQAVIEIRRKLGKNAILKAMNLEHGATAIMRNSQIGGHRK